MDDTVRTEPEMLPVVTVPADAGAAGEADKSVLDGIVARLASEDMAVTDAVQKPPPGCAVISARRMRSTPRRCRSWGKSSARRPSSSPARCGALAEAGVQVRIINVATAAISVLSVTAPRPAAQENASASKPAAMGSPIADLFSLAGRGRAAAVSHLRRQPFRRSARLSGGMAYTGDSDFIDRDFVLDVVFEFAH